MKKITLLSAALGLVLLAAPATAKDKTSPKTTTYPATTTHENAPRTSASTAAGGMDFAVGFSSFGGVDATGGSVGGQALSVKFNLGANGSVQGLFAIGSTNPFTFSIGGVYRHRFLGDGDPGFHLGAGLNLGTVGAPGSTFFLNLFPLMGFHFPLGGSLRRITLMFDGGINFHLTPGFQMQAGPGGGLLGGLLGGSIHYQI